MKRFRFSLRKVHKLRRHQERAARQALAVEVGRMAALEEQQRKLFANLRACEDVGALDASAALAQALSLGLRANAQALERDIQGQALRVHQVQAAYQESRRDLKVLDKLYERRFAAWQADVQATEQAEFDEMARVRFVARREEEQGA